MGSPLTRLVAPGLHGLEALKDRVYRGKPDTNYPTAQERHQRGDEAGHCRDDRPNYREPPARLATDGHEA